MLEALCTLLFVSGNFLQRAHNEVPLLHTRMGKYQFRSVHGDGVVGDQVYVNRAVVVLHYTIDTSTLLCATQFLLYLLCFSKA